MDQAAIAAMLGEAAIFARLSPEALLACAAEFREQRFDQGQMLFARGDAGDRLILVAEGRVRLAVTTEDGRELSVRHAVGGELLGEIAVLDGGARSADAVALTAVLAYSLRRAPFEQLVARYPALSAGIIAFLCRRLRQTTDQLEGIALYSIEVRLARFLLVGLAGRKPAPGKRVPLDMAFSQGELAQLLGASRPKVNAALGSLEQAGAIHRTADRIFCDPDLLAKLAGIGDG
ncbi:Crp/Fnr family transcriptional regulator [Bosea sp. (in: a-proteobacteria)]|uniref:Crp/Fnr family transcriptional regulator n=1 Tax=Bosea sp. (in: a-proteobacteria) TaxID=1871050 RepID=UPI002735F80F|nr:Crp/Fnr family transcriptional regulator [Bosea sp. (in: a-proteobacteria)]MDP3407560.1 Crp/Fnr family transcriptional regulator [Bosea sp. (in: a-proteobacteria)]